MVTQLHTHTHILSLSFSFFSPPLVTNSSTPTLPSIAVTYRQPPEQFNPPENRHNQQLPTISTNGHGGSGNNVREKDRFHTLNRSIRALLNVRRGPRSPNGHHRASANVEKDLLTLPNTKAGPSFQSYVNVPRTNDDGEREMDEEDANLRESPLAHRRRATNVQRSNVLYEENDASVLHSTAEKVRRRGNGPMNMEERTHEATRRVSSGGSSDSLGDMNGSHGGSTSSGTVRGGYSSGRSDSLTRGMKPPYSGYQLRRYGSSESMSSQSTLVNRTGYEAEDDSQQSITDLIGMGRSGLTRSQINAHMRSEARKQRHSYHGGGGGGGSGGVGGVRGVAVGGVRGIDSGAGGERVGGNSDVDGGGGRVVYYTRLHPELQFPYDETKEKKKRASRRRREVHGANTPDDDDEGTDILYSLLVGINL